MLKTQFADTVIDFDIPQEYLHQSLVNFECNDNKKSSDIYVRIAPMAKKSTFDDINGNEFYSGDYELHMTENLMSARFRNTVFIRYIDRTVSDGGSVYIDIYVTHLPTSAENEAFQNELFNSLRGYIFMSLNEKSIIMLHSSSVKYKNKIYPFSAFPGTGKSTHTQLWRRLFECRIHSDNYNAIGFDDNNSPIVHDHPWSTSSAFNRFDTMQLGGIIFLYRSTSNIVKPVEASHAVNDILRHCVLTDVSSNIANTDARIAERITKSVPIACLECTADDESAHVMRRYIDNYML